MKALLWTAVILTAVAGIMVWWSRTKGLRIESFWDAVRNPGSMPDVNAINGEISNAARQLRGSPENIAKLVDYFVFEAASSRDAWTERRILGELGTEAYPRALAILRDPSLQASLVVLNTPSELSLPEAPINRLCEIFDSEDSPPIEAAALLTRFVSLESKEIKKSAVLTIGSIGLVESLPHLKQALRDSDEYVRSYALMGLERAIDGNRIDDAAKAAFYEMVAELWPKDTAFNVSEHVASIMLRLDRERAIQRMMSDELFTPEFRSLDRILEAFEKHKIDPPRLNLLALIERLCAGSLEYPRDNMLREALSLLGRKRNEEDLSTLEKWLDHENETVAMGAIRGLYHYHRFAETIRDPWEVEQDKGWEALTPAEKHICAIESLNNEINNGGFAQYYFNSSGNHWADAVSGLEVIGAAKHRELMLQTLMHFPENAPSSKRSIRSEQLAKIVRKQEDPFNEQDSAWYNLKDENLDKLMLRYNLANLQGRQKMDIDSSR